MAKYLLTEEDRLRSQASRGESTDALVENQFSHLSAPHRASIRDRALEMPKTCVRTYLTAMRGKSMAAGIKAFCSMCMGWDDYREGIRSCTDPACPLYEYRPFIKR